jgi:hypothetical protein
MRRRLDLVAGMVTRPGPARPGLLVLVLMLMLMLMLDESTTGLDPRSRDQLWAVVRRLAPAYRRSDTFSDSRVMTARSLLATALSWLAACLGLLLGSPETANGATFLFMFVPYLSTVFVPAATMTRALRPVAANQPFTPVIETLRGLWTGHTSTGASAAREAGLAVVYRAGILVITAAAGSWLFRHRTAGWRPPVASSQNFPSRIPSERHREAKPCPRSRSKCSTARLSGLSAR